MFLATSDTNNCITSSSNKFTNFLCKCPLDPSLRALFGTSHNGTSSNLRPSLTKYGPFSHRFLSFYTHYESLRPDHQRTIQNLPTHHVFQKRIKSPTRRKYIVSLLWGTRILHVRFNDSTQSRLEAPRQPNRFTALST